jgi:hypothetical protein
MNLQDEIVKVMHHVMAKTSHGQNSIGANNRQMVEEYLNELAPEIAEIQSSPPATSLQASQVSMVVTDGYATSREDRDIFVYKTNRYIMELCPSIYELDWAERKLVCERQDRRDEYQNKYIPTFQEIREIVKQAKRNTIHFKVHLTNIYRMMDGKRNMASPFMDTEDELMKLIKHPRELPQLEPRELPQLIGPEFISDQ